MTNDLQILRAPAPGRARKRVGSGLGFASAVLVVVSIVGATPAAAAPVRDRDPAASVTTVRRLAEVDAALRAATKQHPEAEIAVFTTAQAVVAARAEEQRVLAAGPPAPGTSSGAAADSVAAAILTELAPEGATAARMRAEELAAAAVTQRDALVSTAATASKDRATLLASLDEQGERRTSWSVQLLDRLGAPVTTENVRGLSAWIEAEFNKAEHNNPLATTMGAPGARSVNDHGVKAYPSVDVGLDATVRTLRNGLYDGILFAMARGDSALVFMMAVAASPWGTGENAVRRLFLDS